MEEGGGARGELGAEGGAERGGAGGPTLSTLSLLSDALNHWSTRSSLAKRALPHCTLAVPSSHPVPLSGTAPTTGVPQVISAVRSLAGASCSHSVSLRATRVTAGMPEAPCAGKALAGSSLPVPSLHHCVPKGAPQVRSGDANPRASSSPHLLSLLGPPSLVPKE